MQRTQNPKRKAPSPARADNVEYDGTRLLGKFNWPTASSPKLGGQAACVLEWDKWPCTFRGESSTSGTKGLDPPIKRRNFMGGKLFTTITLLFPGGGRGYLTSDAHRLQLVILVERSLQAPPPWVPTPSPPSSGSAESLARRGARPAVAALRPGVGTL